jgi:hypothetical protein
MNLIVLPTGRAEARVLLDIAEWWRVPTIHMGGGGENVQDAVRASSGKNWSEKRKKHSCVRIKEVFR